MRVIRATSAKGGELFDGLIGKTDEFAANWGTHLAEIVAAKTKYTDIFHECVRKKEVLLAKIPTDSAKKEESPAAAAAPGFIARWLGRGAVPAEAPAATKEEPSAATAPAPGLIARLLGRAPATSDATREELVETAVSASAAAAPASSDTRLLAAVPPVTVAAVGDASTPAAGSPTAALLPVPV